VRCEKGGIRRVLMNLIGNSMKFTKVGGIVLDLLMDLLIWASDFLGWVYTSDLARVTSYAWLQNDPCRDGCHRHRKGMDVPPDRSCKHLELMINFFNFLLCFGFVQGISRSFLKASVHLQAMHRQSSDIWIRHESTGATVPPLLTGKPPSDWHRSRACHRQQYRPL
jgi:hypothetical protein